MLRKFIYSKVLGQMTPKKIQRPNPKRGAIFLGAIV